MIWWGEQRHYIKCTWHCIKCFPNSSTYSPIEIHAKIFLRVTMLGERSPWLWNLPILTGPCGLVLWRPWAWRSCLWGCSPIHTCSVVLTLQSMPKTYLYISEFDDSVFVLIICCWALNIFLLKTISNLWHFLVLRAGASHSNVSSVWKTFAFSWEIL